MGVNEIKGGVGAGQRWHMRAQRRGETQFVGSHTSRI